MTSRGFPSPPEERRQDKLQRKVVIMDAAERVFLERGVHNATMDQIAQAAELSKGALYLCFKTKADLYLAIAIRALKELIALWQAVQDSNLQATGFDLFKGTLEAYIEYALQHRDRFRVALGWTASEYRLPDDSAAFREYQRMIERSSRFGYEALDRGKRDGSVRADLDIVSTSFHVWGGTVGMLMLIYTEQETNRRLPFAVNLHQALIDHVTALLASLQNPVSSNAVPQRLVQVLRSRGEFDHQA